MLHSSSSYSLLNSLKHEHTNAHSVTFATKSSHIVQIDAHGVGVYRIQIVNPKSGSLKKASAHRYPLIVRDEAIGEFSLFEQQATEITLEQHPHTLIINSTTLAVHLRSNDEPLVSITDIAVAEEGDIPQWRLNLSVSDHELFGLSRTSQNMTICGQMFHTSEQWRDMLPFVWHRSGWGFYLNSTGDSRHDVAATNSSQYQIELQDQVLDFFLFAGDPAEIFNQFGLLTGRVQQVPVWSVGPIVHSQQADFSVAMRALTKWRQSPACVETVLLTDSLPWLLNTKSMVEWDLAVSPEAREQLADIKERQISLSLSVLPAIFPGSPIFAEFEDKAWLLSSDSGDAYIFNPCPLTQQRPYALLDLTHKDVYRFWFERLCLVLDEGLASLTVSLPEDMPLNIEARNGDTGVSLTQGYLALLKQAVFDALSINKVPPEGVLFSTELGVTDSRYVFQVPNLALSQTSLAQRLQHIFVTGHMGCTASILPLSTITKTARNWLLELVVGVMGANFILPSTIPTCDDQTQALAQEWLRFRSRLVPYILGALEDAGRLGLPVQRSMALSFPKDSEAQNYPMQYLFGPALLVSAGLDEAGYVEVYLPEGEAWWDLRTGWRYEGGQLLSFNCEPGQIPVFGREGHVLCLGPELPQLSDFNTAKVLDEVWMFGMPLHNPCVFRNKIRVMQMQGSSYIKGLEGLRILPSEGLEVKRRGAEVRISKER